MLNSEFSLQVARRLAGVSWDHAGGDLAVAIDHAVRRAYSRPANADEMKKLEHFIHEHANELRNVAGQREELAVPIAQLDFPDIHLAAALTDLCLALLNSNEFIYID
jgi:hypothetical protein